MTRLDETQIQAFIDAIPTPVFVKDNRSRPVLVNSSACDLYGLSREQIMGGDLEKHFSPERVEAFRRTDGQVLSSGEDAVYEEQIVDLAGNTRILATRKRLMGAPDGAPLIIGVASDITALRETEQHYRHSVDLNPQVPWTADTDGAIDEVGARGEEITGLPSEQTRGEGWLKCVHPEDLAETLTAWKQALTTGDAFDTEYRVRTRDGSYRWFRASAAARKDRNGKIIRWYGTLEDVHERKVAEQALQESEERFRLAAQAAGLGIWDYDAVKRTRSWSAELRRIFGLTEAEPADLELARNCIHESDRKQFDQMARAAADQDPIHHFKGTFRILRASDGEERWVETNGWKVIEDNHLTRVVITIQDITDERKAGERLAWAATHDPLTKLPNRALFQERMNSAIADARQKGARTGLLLLDVDDLKQINDTMGHDAGDALLSLFSDRLQRSVRSGDTVARLGGDEFAVVLPNLAGKREINRVASRIIAQMREPFLYGKRRIECVPSIGASHFPSHGADSEELLKSADLALYAAKTTARGGLVVFNGNMKRNAKEQNIMIAAARQAVRDDRIVPFYQPKVDLATGQITGFEALLRWRRVNGAVQGPSSIRAAFGDHELAGRIGERMLERITSDVRLWMDRGIDFGSVAINAGEAELRNERFSDCLLGKLSKASIPTSRIQLEVVESVFVGRGAEHVENTLKILSREGVAIALDDFGTGYASLTHLKKYPVDIVKVDQSFVQDMSSDVGSAAIVDAVVGLGRSLGISVVAEGIETQTQADLLRKIGCKYGQGYLFSKAVPAKRVPGLLAENHRNPASVAATPALRLGQRL